LPDTLYFDPLTRQDIAYMPGKVAGSSLKKVQFFATDLGENKEEVAKVENQLSKRVRMKRKSCFKSIIKDNLFQRVFHSPGMTEMKQTQRKEKFVSYFC